MHNTVIVLKVSPPLREELGEPFLTSSLFSHSKPMQNSAKLPKANALLLCHGPSDLVLGEADVLALGVSFQILLSPVSVVSAIR